MLPLSIILRGHLDPHAGDTGVDIREQIPKRAGGKPTSKLGGWGQVGLIDALS